MTSAAALSTPQQYPSSPASSQIPSSLIASRPILPLPKRRVPSNPSPSSTTTSNSSSLPLPPTQIFTQMYSSTSNKTATSQYGDAADICDSSDSDDEGDDAGSTVSSVGREDFNSKNKKKRKIPLSATSNGNVGNLVQTDTSPSSSVVRSGNGKGRLSGWRVPSATVRTEGGYSRRKTMGVLSRTTEQMAESTVVEYDVTMNSRQSEKENGEIDTTLSTPERTPAPSGQFSFTFPSPLTLPIVPPVSPVSTTMDQGTYPTAPTKPPVSAPPPPPPPPVLAQCQENIPPQQPYSQPPPQQQQQQQAQSQVQAQTQTQIQPQQQPQQPSQQTQQPRTPQPGMKHPNSEKARRVAQLTKLRERYRTGPKPETDEIYICQFCTYGFIYGEDPIYLVKQYNRKRNAEIRLRRERRKMLEKARMKGKKGALPNSQPGSAGANGNEEEYDDDGLCCTCGQKVGQHNHVPSGGGTVQQQQQQAQAGGQQGRGPGKGK